MQQLRQEYFGDKAGEALPVQGASSTLSSPVSQPGKVVSFKKYVGVAIAVAAVLVIGVFVWNPFAGNLYEKYARLRKWWRRWSGAVTWIRCCWKLLLPSTTKNLV